VIADMEAASEPKAPLIRVAPRCSTCSMFDMFDDG
jgi:hypothetical protein